MKSFPVGLVPQNLKKFRSSYYRNRQKCRLRALIYEYMISSVDLSSGFDLTNYPDLFITEELVTELTALGWQTRLCYGNTCLFIWSEEHPIRLPEGTEFE